MVNKNNDAKKRSLQKALKGIKREFGKGAVMRMSDKPMDVKAYSTGSLALDKALGIGGYPQGRVVELYGPESAGKTTMALEATAQVQKQGGTVAYIDAENAINPEYAAHLGVNVKNLILSQPDTGEEGMQICENLAKSSAIDLIVVDSVAALVPKAEIQGEMGDAHVGLQARLMSQSLRLLSGTLSRTNTTCLFLNQIRDKVGVMFGSPETTPGGQALKFYASQILRISRGQKIKDKGKVIGFNSKMTIRKNKVAPPFTSCHIPLMNGTNGIWGIDTNGELIALASKYDIIQKGGAWFTFPNDHREQGALNATKYLQNNPQLANDIEIQVRKKMNIPLTSDEKKSLKNTPNSSASTSKSSKAKNSKTSKSKNSNKK